MKKLKKIKTKSIIKYCLFFIIQIILSRATTIHGMKPFGLGFFVALVYSRQNLIILAPMYIIASLIADFSLASLISSAVPAVIFIIAYWVHYKIGKSMNMFFANIYTLLSQIPYMIFAFGKMPIFEVLLSVLITQIFAYCAIIIMYALLIRGLRYRLTVDELISGSAVLGALALGLYQCVIYKFNIFYAFSAFLILFVSYMFPAAVPLIVSTVLGLGASFSDGQIIMVAIMVCWTIGVIMFRNISIYVSAAALIIVDIIFGFYFNAYSSYTYFNIITVAVGVLLFVVLPKKYKYAFSGFMGNVRDGYASRTIINRNRLDVSNRLFSIANVFEDMQYLLQDETQIEPDNNESREKLAKDISMSFCAECPDCKNCFASLGTDTSVILTDILEAVETKGKASILDMPPFITSRCRRVNGLIQAINDRLNSHQNFKKLSKSLDNGKLMLAAQMGGMAEILDNLGHDIKQCVSFDTSREKLIIDELIYHNIICKEAIVYGDGGDISVTVVVREIDANKQILTRIISKIMRTKLVRDGAPDIVGDTASVHLILAPKYDVVFGEAVKKRDGEDVCGDCRSIQKIGEKKLILAVCDGMGSGKSAEQYSNNAVQMIENFYHAGFKNDVVLALVNKLLSLKNEENFSALDMCVIDLNSGGCDFIKLGAPFNFIKRRENIEIISGHSLPIGIIESAEPAIERKILFNGDLVILFSDGVSDVHTEAELMELIDNYRGNNPQGLADEILESSIKRGASDDITVLVARLYNKL